MKTTILGMNAPSVACTDQKCPFHGQLNVKPELLRGAIVKKDVNHSATIVWYRSYYVPKYERYEIRKSRVRVHNPPCLNAQVGDEVIVAKTRPLSKMKNHVIVSIAGTRGKAAASAVLKEQQKESGLESKPKKKEGETKHESN